MPAAAAAAASSSVSTNSIVSCRLPLTARRSATVSLLCLVNAIVNPSARVSGIARRRGKNKLWPRELRIEPAQKPAFVGPIAAR